MQVEVCGNPRTSESHKRERYFHIQRAVAPPPAPTRLSSAVTTDDATRLRVRRPGGARGDPVPRPTAAPAVRAARASRPFANMILHNTALCVLLLFAPVSMRIIASNGTMRIMHIYASCPAFPLALLLRAEIHGVGGHRY